MSVQNNSNASEYFEKIGSLLPIPTEEEHSQCFEISPARIGQALAITLSTSGRVPYIPLSLQLFPDSEFLRAIFVYGNVTSFAVLYSWSAKELTENCININKGLSPVSSESQGTNSFCGCYKVIRLSKELFSVFAGGLSLFPFAVVAADYNNSNAYAAWIIAADAAFPSYSVSSALERALQPRISSEGTIGKLKDIRKKLLKNLRSNIDHVVTHPEERDEYVIKINKVLQLSEGDDRSIEVAKLFLSESEFGFEEQSEECCSTVNVASKFFGTIFTLGQLGLLGIIAFEGAENIYDADWFQGGTAAGVVLVNAYLAGTLIFKSSSTICKTISNVFTGTYKRTLTQQHAPKLTLALGLIETVTALLCIGPALKLSEEYFSFNEPLAIYMDITASCASIFLVITTIFNISEKTMEYFLEQGYGADQPTNEEITDSLHALGALLDLSENFLVDEVMNRISDKGKIDFVSSKFYTEQVLLEILEENDLLPNIGSQSKHALDLLQMRLSQPTIGEVIALKNAMEALFEMIKTENSPLFHLATFLKAMPSDFLDNISSDVEVTIEMLDEIITEYSNSDELEALMPGPDGYTYTTLIEYV